MPQNTYDSYEIHPKLEEFQKYAVGQRIKLKVNRAGSVEVIP